MPETRTDSTANGHPLRAPARAGFTLVEVLLAMTLTAMICAVLYGVVHGTLTTQARLAGYNDAALLADRIADMIADDLGAVYVAEYDGDKPFVVEDNTELSLPADRLTLISATSARMPTLEDDPVGVAGFREITYAAVPSRTREGYLAIYRREAILDRKAAEGGRFALLHDQVEAFDLRFLGRDDQEIAWDKGRDTWEYTPEDGLPRLVLISLTVSVGTPQEREPESTGGEGIVDRFRRQEVYRIVALPPGMSEDTAKLAALEPKDPRAPQSAAGPAATGPSGPAGQTPGLNPFLGGLPPGGVQPSNNPATNPLLKLLERHQLGR